MMNKQNDQPKIDAASFMATEKPSRVTAAIKAEAVKLIETGYSLVQIQRYLDANGCSASKSTISGWAHLKETK